MPRDSDWIALTDVLLRGVAHALSNRTGALSAIRDLGIGDAEARPLLASEIERLTQLIHLLRLIPAESGALPEAIDVGPLMTDVLSVLTLHPRARELRWETSVECAPQPVRAERWALFRSLLLLCSGALADGLAQGARELRVTVSGDAETTEVAIRGGGGQSIPWSEPAAYAVELARRSGGELSDSGELALRMPTLGAVRRRDDPPAARSR